MGTVTNQAERQTQVETTPEIVDALLEAARYDDFEDITRLASSGISLDSKDSLGRTALHMAAANGHLDIVEYLISQGVDINAFNEEKNTPLHWACLNGHTEAVKN
ncbi:ankyrin repeat-containing protein [Salix suchowensis]|nr:ankyrin repeat-containing protein [Salix suchowensis]